MPTQNEYNTAKKRQRIESIKIQLLNYKLQIVDEIQGNVVGQPSFTINADNDIRRTCNFTIIPTDSSFDIKYGSKLWLDKYVKVYKGIKTSVYSDDFEWTNMGIYLINNPQHAYSANSNTITINGIDLMAKLTGLRNGNIEGMSYIIPQGSNIRNVMIDLLALAGFTNYSIDEPTIIIDSQETQSLPYEIKVDAGGTIYNILSQLKDVVADYQMYFDVDGTFCFNRIPNGENMTPIVTDDIWDKVLISYNRNYDFSTVKNSITVLGKVHDIVNYSDGTYSTSYNTYVLSIASLVTIIDKTVIGCVVDSTHTISTIRVNNTNYNICNELGESSITLNEDEYYVFQYDSSKTKFIFLGHVQPTATVEETNIESPYYVNGTMGKVRIVLSGGEYDNIYSDELAKQRAKKELYLRCKLNDSLSLQCVPIYWLDVNTVIEITIPNKHGDEEKNKYMIKQININDSQSITLERLYD